MPRKVTLKDNKNGVSVIVDEQQDGAAPDVMVVDGIPDGKTEKCGLVVPPNSELHKALVTLATTLNGAQVTAGAPMLDYTQMDYGTFDSKAGDYRRSGVGSISTKGEVAGDLSNFNGRNLAKEIKAACAKKR